MGKYNLIPRSHKFCKVKITEKAWDPKATVTMKRHDVREDRMDRICNFENFQT